MAPSAWRRISMDKKNVFIGSSETSVDVSELLFLWRGARREAAVEAPLRDNLFLASSVQGRSAGPEVGRGVPTPPSLPLDSTHPATGQGLHALNNPKEEVEAQKS